MTQLAYAGYKHRPMSGIKKKYNYRCGSDQQTVIGLRQWYETSLGQRLLEQEKSSIDATLSGLFGYHLVQVGILTDKSLLSSSLITNRMVLTRDAGAVKLAEDSKACIVGGYPDVMPIASDSLDVVVLPHVLEFNRDPHQVLREVDRILIPEGHVVITGFNPWSSWIGWRLLLGWRSNLPWCGRFLSVSRVKDWLALLGFDIVSTKYSFYRPAFQHEGIMDKLTFIEQLGQRFWPILGASYTLVAQKRVTTLTPIRPRWKPRRRLLPESVVEPQNRNNATYTNQDSDNEEPTL